MSTSPKTGCIATRRIRHGAARPKRRCAKFSTRSANCSRRSLFLLLKKHGAIQLWPVSVMLANRSSTRATTSVHVQEFPEPQNRGTEAIDQVEELLRLRGIVGQAIEQARQEKLIGNTLEARVVLNSDSDVTEKIPREELEEFFILSDLTIQQAKEPSASVTKTPYKKCARCWRHRPTVGTSKAHPDLCDRCESVVARNDEIRMTDDEGILK